ncbi:UPF0149 family protein [Glaciecola petra]|uniref:UPF0149 family protein n=1 Tax=Glaciecola petra TaxID=3075602 RepID=A0ABU2ZLN5_9ALTE|nr:UPF0149 family protein [Aestuariibacter sp. P117]MDT0593532.1 UPF0149 family protein [Aestuariibacter sp. P117]
MSNNYNSYESISTILQQHDVVVDAAEIQGILCGMLAGGMDLDDREWTNALNDVVNQGDKMHPKVIDQTTQMYDKLCQEFVEADFALKMCLPNDDEPLNERGKALVSWVQGFMLGFGLQQQDLSNCSEEVKEALDDFSQISKMDEEMTDDEESEQAFFEVVEYVRIGTMLCFNEMGKSLLDSRQQAPVIH